MLTLGNFCTKTMCVETRNMLINRMVSYGLHLIGIYKTYGTKWIFIIYSLFKLHKSNWKNSMNITLCRLVITLSCPGVNHLRMVFDHLFDQTYNRNAFLNHSKYMNDKLRTRQYIIISLVVISMSNQHILHAKFS